MDEEEDDDGSRLHDQLAGAHVACFLLPLPEPLPLPAGIPMVFAELETTHEHLTRVMAHERDAVSPDQDPISADVRRIERHVSLLVHQRRAPSADVSVMRTLLDLSRDALPWARENDRSEHISGRSVLDKAVETARSLRPGSSRRPAPHRDGTAPLTHESDVTVVEAVVYLRYPDDEDAVSDAFDEALVAVRELQETYYQLRRQPLTMCRRESLPPFIPFAVGRLRMGSAPELISGLNLFMTHTNLAGATRGEELDDAELTRFRVLLGSPPHAFSDYLHLLREADLSSRVRGDHRGGAVMAGAASEAFLDTLLLHLMWEDCTTPSDAALVFSDPRRGLLPRARRDVSALLGGNWDEKRPGPFRDWHDSCFQLRHRAVHAGYFPQAHEVHTAIAALNALVSAVGAQLRSARTGRFPRTLILLAGQDNLERDGLWRGKVKQVALDSEEPNWGELFQRYTAVVDLHRRIAAGTALAPDAARSHLLLVPDTTSAHRWVLHDHQAMMACLADPPPQADVEPLATTVRRYVEVAAQAKVGVAHSVLMARDGSALKPVGPWMAAHELVPEVAVMRDGSDAGLR